MVAANISTSIRFNKNLRFPLLGICIRTETQILLFDHHEARTNAAESSWGITFQDGHVKETVMCNWSGLSTKIYRLWFHQMLNSEGFETPLIYQIITSFVFMLIFLWRGSRGQQPEQGWKYLMVFRKFRQFCSLHTKTGPSKARNYFLPSISLISILCYLAGITIKV